MNLDNSVWRILGTSWAVIASMFRICAETSPKKKKKYIYIYIYIYMYILNLLLV